jgi:elongator complex protein 3
MKPPIDYSKYQENLITILSNLQELEDVSVHRLSKIIRAYPKDNGDVFSRGELVEAYRELAGKFGLNEFSEDFLSKIRMKPIRTASGVAPVTVLTNPFACPGKCIFCPNDIRMPKSYLADEPGAQRAERNWFDPYLQAYSRLEALEQIGHPTDKVELIVLGGTWSFYPEKYQIWFIKQCFKALNDFGVADDRDEVLEHYRQMSQQLANQQSYSPTANPEQNKKGLIHHAILGEKKTKTYNQTISELYTAPEILGGFDNYQAATWNELEREQKKNEKAVHRSVGLVIETRPDNISESEVLRIRRLGCTKTQIGVQSLQDEVLDMNNRGHDVAATRRAFNLLRQAGLKIHAHWMANLYGSSVSADIADFAKLFEDPDFHPDELKIYPCSLIESAELMSYYQRGLWHPYSKDELLKVLSACILATPEYCRLTRVIRDIPSTDIVVGNKLTNFRQIVEQHLEESGTRSRDIRSREIRTTEFDPKKIKLKTVEYSTSVSHEVFLQFVVNVAEKNLTRGNERHQLVQREKILGFLRLSLPTTKNFISELEDAAIIREIHVYGQMALIGDEANGKAQHLGLGSKLIKRAIEIAEENKYQKLAVISAIGTREYYRQKGFQDGELYQWMSLT